MVIPYNLIQHHTIPSEFNIYLEFNNENLLRLMDNALAHGGASNKGTYQCCTL